jgi:hypothetical protein
MVAHRAQRVDLDPIFLGRQGEAVDEYVGERIVGPQQEAPPDAASRYEVGLVWEHASWQGHA